MPVSRPRLEALHHSMESALKDGVIPFWLERAWDEQNGGFRTNFDAQGRAQPVPEKYLNTQARLVWWFSTLSRQHPDVSAYRRLADDGAAWLIDHFWDPAHGGWFWKVNADGSRLDDGKVVYGQSFAIYALSEHARATGDVRSLHLASDTFDLLQIHCADTRYGGYYENLEPDWQVAPGGFYAGDRKGLDTHMHLMEAFTVLYASSEREIHRRKLHEVLDVIVDHMIDPETGCGRNQFSLDFTPIPAIAIHRTWNAEREGEAPAVPTDTTSYGHNIELAWLINRALQVAGLDPAPYRPILYRLAEHSYKHGVDWEFGGVYRDGVASAGPLIRDKEFWQNAEALVGFLDAYTTWGEERFFDAFDCVWRFVDAYMINHDIGEFRTLLTREGQPVDAKIGNPWKVAYHSGRALLECSNRLGALVNG